MFVENEDVEKLKLQKDMLRKMYEAEKQKVAGHEELSKVQSAYVAVLLKKLGANKDNPVTISNDEVKEALAKDNVRVGVADKGVWTFYCEE